MLRRLLDSEVTHHDMGAHVPSSLDPDVVADWTTYDAMRFVAPALIEIKLPWNERVVCALPVTDLPIATYVAR